MEKNQKNQENANLVRRLVNNSWDQPPVSKAQAIGTINEAIKRAEKSETNKK